MRKLVKGNLGGLVKRADSAICRRVSLIPRRLPAPGSFGQISLIIDVNGRRVRKGGGGNGGGWSHALLTICHVVVVVWCT